MKASLPNAHPSRFRDAKIHLTLAHELLLLLHICGDHPLESILSNGSQFISTFVIQPSLLRAMCSTHILGLFWKPTVNTLPLLCICYLIHVFLFFVSQWNSKRASLRTFLYTFCYDGFSCY
ncbi:unnamed protein product [Lampetra planeri]